RRPRRHQGDPVPRRRAGTDQARHLGPGHGRPRAPARRSVSAGWSCATIMKKPAAPASTSWNSAMTSTAGRSASSQSASAATTVHGEDDEQIPLSDAQALYDACGSKDKTLRVFTSEEGGAQHCQRDYLTLGCATMWSRFEDKLLRA